jgi:ABC-type glucose/galactose transport system permease subunit
MVATLVRVRLLLALGIVYLMTAKPQALSTGLFILLGAIVVGLLCAAGTWSSHPAPGKS